MSKRQALTGGKLERAYLVSLVIVSACIRPYHICLVCTKIGYMYVRMYTCMPGKRKYGLGSGRRLVSHGNF